MSIRTVNREIRKALTDNVLTQSEAETIVKTAEKGRITTGETKAVANLYEDGQFKFPTHFPPGALPQPRPPMYDLQGGAAQTFMNFFIQERVPQGKVYGEMKEDVEAAIRDINHEALATAEPNTKHLHHVHIDDKRMVDGPRTDAYVNTEKDEFYLKVTGAGMAGPDTVGPYWYGPIALTELSPTERVAHRIDDVWTLAQDAGLSTTRTHTPRLSKVEDNGDGTFTATLAAINWRDPSDVLDTAQAIVSDKGDFLSRVAEDETADIA